LGVGITHIVNKSKIETVYTSRLTTALFDMDYYNKMLTVGDYFNNNTVKNVFNFIILNFGIYIAWIFVHYIAAHLYVHWCVPATIVGFLLSPFLVPAPHCYGLRWVIYHGGNSIIAMWTFTGIWILSRILPMKPE
jgi:hypothetical protein